MEQTLITTSPAAEAWKHIGTNERHGIVVPLFSVRTRDAGGLGEYLDLIPLIDWCSEIGFSVIQLLPLNDPGHDISPYNALSAHALNPIHLSLHRLPRAEENPSLQEIYLKLKTLNTTQLVDYETIRPLKENALDAYFLLEKESLLQDPEFASFSRRNPWLRPFALFKSLKKKYQWRELQQWPKDETTDLEKAFQNNQSEIEKETLIQYLCFQQMKQVKIHAEKKGVLLKGDIPILLSPDSADVWMHPELFNLNLRAGAPPDYYSEQGQNWGFPLYTEEHPQQLYAWWRERLDTASQLYDLFRLDHFVGFYRIWGVPEGRPGTEGQFIPADPATWIEHGEKILKEILPGTTLLPIAEDLGTVPPEVRVNMQTLGICGTKVMRWERNWHGDRRYIPLQDYSKMSMTTLSTHDSESLAEWWENTSEEAKLFAEMLGLHWEANLSKSNRQAILKASHSTNSLFHINLLQEYLGLIPDLSWPTAKEDRINIPGIQSKNNWSYRYRPYLEDIIENKELRQAIQNYGVKK